MPDIKDFPRAIAERLRGRHRRRALLRTPFYRRYPYARPVSIFEVDRRVFVSDKLRIMFNGIGKAGHSSVIATLARAESEKDVPMNQAKGSLFIRPSALTAEQVDLLRTYFRFALVRNPYTRTLSAYLDKVVRGKVVPQALKRHSKGSPPTFLDFCLYLEDGGLNDAVHWAPQTRMLVLPFEHYDHIARLEQFNTDISAVLSRIGLSSHLEIGRHDPHKTNSDQKIAEHYCDRSREIIRRLMAEDFRLLGYPE